MLRELLGLHADPADAAMRRQIDGVLRVAFRRCSAGCRRPAR